MQLTSFLHRSAAMLITSGFLLLTACTKDAPDPQLSKRVDKVAVPGLKDGQCYEIWDIYYNTYTGEIVDRVYIDTVCDSPTGPGDTGGGGGGGGGTSPGGEAPDTPQCRLCDGQQSPPAPKPCQTTAALNNSSEFTTKLGLLSDVAANGNVEAAYGYVRSGSTVIQSFIGQSNSGVAVDPYGFNWLTPTLDGLVHNHTDGGFSGFSYDDIAFLQSMYTRGKITNPGTFAYTVTTHQGNVYTLTVSNTINFANFCEQDLSVVLGNLNATSWMDENYTTEQNEQGLLRLLGQMNSGLTLSKKTASGSWSKLGYSNGQVTSTACN